MTYDVNAVISAIEACKENLGENYDETISRIRAESEIREAVKIAVDVSKTFIGISLASFAITGLFARHYFSEGYNIESLKIILLGLSALSAFISMCAGFLAISYVYRRADGRVKYNDDKGLWSTEPIKVKLNFQAWLGAGSVILFIAAIVLGDMQSNDGGRSSGVTIAPNRIAANLSVLPPFTVSGNWSSVTIRKDKEIVFTWAENIASEDNQNGERFSFEVLSE